MIDRGLRDAARHLGAALPHGRTLPEATWQARHRGLKWLLWAHVAGLPIVALLYGLSLGDALLHGAAIAVFAVVAELRIGGHRPQALVVALGLLSCSAALVHITSGLIEAHFHFFVMVAALTLYEDWVPFLAAVAYVFLQHGLMATVMDHDAVFNHPGSAWKWALVHSFFIGALSIVCLASWRASERDREAFRSLVLTLEEGVVMIDRRGGLVAANASARRILGMDPALVVAPGTDDAWMFTTADGERLDGARRPSRITARTGEPQVAVPLCLRRPDGSARWLSVSTRAVDADGDPPYPVVVSFTDVTEEREAADALERSNAELEQFAYIASHDLSEPLRMVSSYLQLLRRRYHGRLDADADEFIDFAVDGANRMRALIEALLAYSRAGRDGEPERVELDAVVTDVLRTLAAAMVDAGAELEVGPLPAVMGDRVQLEQLLQNLVANALKFRREADHARVWVRTEPGPAGMAQVAVADAGIGIDPRHRERVFKMFQRLHDREAYAGTGIGLAICRKIVERHGGRIWVDERPGGGAVFRFTLPPAETPEPSPATPAGTATASRVRVQSLRDG